MQELEKILEEMKEIKDGNRKEKLYAKYPPNSKKQEILNAYSQGYEDGTDNFYNAVLEIIRKYMSGKDSNVPTNDGWISVEERLPTMEEYQKDDGRFILDDGNRRYAGFFDAYTGKFYRYRHVTAYRAELYEDNKVIAWHPLPEPYRPEQEAAQRPEWQDRMLHTFLGGHT